MHFILTKKQREAIIKAWNEKSTAMQDPDKVDVIGIYLPKETMSNYYYHAKQIDNLDEKFWAKLKKILEMDK